MMGTLFTVGWGGGHYSQRDSFHSDTITFAHGHVCAIGVCMTL